MAATTTLTQIIALVRAQHYALNENAVDFTPAIVTAAINSSQIELADEIIRYSPEYFMRTTSRTASTNLATVTGAITIPVPVDFMNMRLLSYDDGNGKRNLDQVPVFDNMPFNTTSIIRPQLWHCTGGLIYFDAPIITGEANVIEISYNKYRVALVDGADVCEFENSLIDLLAVFAAYDLLQGAEYKVPTFAEKKKRKLTTKMNTMSNPVIGSAGAPNLGRRGNRI